MAAPWPQEVTWPSEHREHATKLTKYLRDALACMDGSQNQPISPNRVRFVFCGMTSLLAKVRNVPDLSTIHDNLKVMQVEAKSTSEETTQALANMREEIHSNTAEVKKTAAAGEEAKALAKEAAEVGKTAVNIIREVKNKGSQPIGGLQ